jgi:transaldolase
VRIRQGAAAAPETLHSLRQAGIDLDRVTAELEDDGVQKFAASYASLLEGIEAKVGALTA